MASRTFYPGLCLAQRYRWALALAGIAFVVWVVRATILWCYSPERQLGYFLSDVRQGDFGSALKRVSREEIEGAGLDAEKARKLYLSALAKAGGTKIGEPKEVKTNDSQWQWCRVYSIPVLNAQGEKVGYMRGYDPFSYLVMYYTGSEWKVGFTNWANKIAILIRDDERRKTTYDELAREAGVSPLRFGPISGQWSDSKNRRYGFTEADKLLDAARAASASMRARGDSPKEEDAN